MNWWYNIILKFLILGKTHEFTALGKAEEIVKIVSKIGNTFIFELGENTNMKYSDWPYMFANLDQR